MHSNESVCRKSGRLGLEQVFIDIKLHEIAKRTMNQNNDINKRAEAEGQSGFFTSNARIVGEKV